MRQSKSKECLNPKNWGHFFLYEMKKKSLTTSEGAAQKDERSRIIRLLEQNKSQIIQDMHNLNIVRLDLCILEQEYSKFSLNQINFFVNTSDEGTSASIALFHSKLYDYLEFYSFECLSYSDLAKRFAKKCTELKINNKDSKSIYQNFVSSVVTICSVTIEESCAQSVKFIS